MRVFTDITIRLDKISCETTKIQIWRAWGQGAHKYFNCVNNPGWKEDLGTNMRVVQRMDLQALLLEKIRALNGEVIWKKKLQTIKNTKGEGSLKLVFEDGEKVVTDLVVGAEGIWSTIRRCINEPGLKDGVSQCKMGEERWKPEFSYSEGIYGVSSKVGEREAHLGDTHWILLDSGTASTWALPDGKQFWTISLPSSAPPLRSSTEARPVQEYSRDGAEVSTGGYSVESTEAILKAHENVWHPVSGTFGEVFKNSERIVRAALWHRAWEAEEISSGNIVAIGDAGRAMLPTSGQGACFGIEDATVLANALLNNAPEADEDGLISFKKAIEEYTTARVPRSKRMTNQSYWTGLVTLGERWWWRWLRDFASAWMPMSGDPRAAKKPVQDPMGWLHDVRYKVKVVEDL